MSVKAVTTANKETPKAEQPAKPVPKAGKGALAHGRHTYISLSLTHTHTHPHTHTHTHTLIHAHIYTHTPASSEPLSSRSLN